MASQYDDFSFRISGGPSKFDLMISLFDGNKRPRRTVDFKLEGVDGHIRVAVTAVQQEDGSGESWNYAGHLWHDTEKHWSVEGYFSTKERIGTLNFSLPTSSRWDESSKTTRKTINQTELSKLKTYVSDLRTCGVV